MSKRKRVKTKDLGFLFNSLKENNRVIKDIEHTCGCMRKDGGGGMDWEFGISRCNLLYTE